MGRMSVAINHKPLSHFTHVGKKHGSGTRMYTRKWVSFNPVAISSKVAGRVCRANNVKLRGVKGKRGNKGNGRVVPSKRDSDPFRQVRPM
jgi:hypothetical protein